MNKQYIIYLVFSKTFKSWISFKVLRPSFDFIREREREREFSVFMCLLGTAITSAYKMTKYSFFRISKYVATIYE